MLEKQTASVNLTGSLDTKTEAFTVGQEGVLLAENVDYEYPNKIVKQNGVEDFSKDITNNSAFTSTSSVVPFSTDYKQYALVKNNDVLAIMPQTGYQDFLQYDPITDGFNRFIPSASQLAFNSPAAISNTYKNIAFENDVTYPKIWATDFALSQHKDINFHINTYELSYELIVFSGGIKKVVEIAESNISQAKCLIYDTGALAASDVMLIYLFVNSAHNLVAKWGDINLVFPLANSVNVETPMYANSNSFDAKIIQDILIITYFDSLGEITFAKYSLAGGTLTFLTNQKAVVTLINQDYPMIQLATPLTGIGTEVIHAYYITGNRTIRKIRYDYTSNLITDVGDIMPLDTYWGVDGANQNKYINIGVEDFSISKCIFVYTSVFEVVATGAVVTSSLGFNLRSEIYYYNSSAGVRQLLGQFFHLGSPTNVQIKSLGNSQYIAYFGLSSGLGDRSGLADKIENDLLLSLNFTDGGNVITYSSRPAPIARYNILTGYGEYSFGKAYDFIGDRGKENGRRLILKGDTLAVGNRTVTFKSFQTRIKLYDYTYHEFSLVNDLINNKYQEFNLVTGAYPLTHDGTNFYTLNTSIIPYIYNVSASTSGSMAAGVYNICYYIEYENYNGQVERSPISNVVTITLVAPDDQILLDIKTDNFNDVTTKPLIYKFFLTEPSGTVFYLNKQVLGNIAARQSITIPTTTTSEIIYTAGGVLESSLLPPITYSHTAKTRVFVINGEDQNEIWFSNRALRNEVPSFNGLLVLRIDSENSARDNTFIGISSMDDKVILFKRSNLFYFYGEGPNELGVGNTFTEIFKISTDVGCTEPRSIVQTPVGIIFKSLKGYYLLSRDLQLGRIGEPISSYDSLTCNNALLLEKRNEVRFLTSSVTLIYNYERNKWAVATFGGDDATIYNDDYFILKRSTPSLFKLGTGYLDTNGDVTPMKVVTPWYKVDKIQDYGRFYHAYILGRFKSAHDLIVKAYYNYDDSSFDTFTIKPLLTDKQYQYRVNIPRQKCESIKFEIYDDNQSGTGESMELIDLTFTIGLKKGTYKISEKRRY